MGVQKGRMVEARRVWFLLLVTYLDVPGRAFLDCAGVPRCGVADVTGGKDGGLNHGAYGRSELTPMLRMSARWRN